MAQDKTYYTPAEYLSLEEKAEYKNEYYQGKIVAMSGASLNHNRITRNLVTSLSSLLDSKGCEIFSADLRLWIADRNFYVYPDIMVICGAPALASGRTDTVTNPTIVIEVLSESTEQYDRGKKFRAYWTLESLEEYILIDQYQIRVEYFRRIGQNEWKLVVLTKIEEALTLESHPAEIPLSRIYRNVSWDEGEREQI